jgi:hypothetical protein
VSSVRSGSATIKKTDNKFDRKAMQRAQSNTGEIISDKEHES